MASRLYKTVKTGLLVDLIYVPVHNIFYFQGTYCKAIFVSMIKDRQWNFCIFLYFNFQFIFMLYTP